MAGMNGATVSERDRMEWKRHHFFDCYCILLLYMHVLHYSFKQGWFKQLRLSLIILSGEYNYVMCIHF